LIFAAPRHDAAADATPPLIIDMPRYIATLYFRHDADAFAIDFRHFLR